MLEVSRTCRISVVLPVFNGAEHLSQAIKSVLDQTYTGWEMILVNDGSTDSTAQVARTFVDPRIKYIAFASNQGLVQALNVGFDKASTEFIARMDADDVCEPSRFEKQLRFMDQNPNVGICGSGYKCFGRQSNVVRMPCRHEEVSARLFFRYAIAHPTAMLRRSMVEEQSLRYDPEFVNAEDFDLFSRASVSMMLANLPDVLLKYRVHSTQVGSLGAAAQSRNTNKVRRRALLSMLTSASEEDILLHLGILDGRLPFHRFTDAEQWLLNMRRVNVMSKRYHPPAFDVELRTAWFWLHFHNALKTRGLLASYWASSLRDVHSISPLAHIKFLLRVLFAQHR